METNQCDMAGECQARTPCHTLAETGLTEKEKP